MKRIMSFLTVALFTFLLAACNIQSVEEYEQLQEQERSLETKEQQKVKAENDVEAIEKSNEPSEKEAAEPEKQEAASEQKNNETEPKEKSENKEQKQAVTQSTEKPEQQVKKQQPTNTEAEAVKPSSNEQKPSSEKQQVEKPKQPKPPVEKKRTVTIAIRVDTLLKNWDLLDPALQSEKYVPKNGVILKQTHYELLSEKDTVWDVLQRATKEHKIQMEYQGANENIYNSVYVEGINHLYEFSAGELSGWMYQVNGVYPNYGCSQYVLKDGDVIEWNYTVDLGRDLGHFWDGTQ